MNIKDSELIKKFSIHPQHKLGQNFLFNPRLLDFIADQGDVAADDCVIEIGPGTGSLTRRLLSRGCSVTAFEIDSKLCGLLRDTLSGEKHFNLIEGDVLERKNCLSRDLLNTIETQKKENSRIKIIANLPYGCSVPLLTLLLERTEHIDTIVVTVQLEVADRFCAEPGSSSYGIISVLAQVTSKVEKLKKIKSSSFWPEPEIDSAVIRFNCFQENNISRPILLSLKKILRFSFSQRRKKLRKRLLKKWPALNCTEFLSEASRPQDVSPQIFLSIAENCFI